MRIARPLAALSLAAVAALLLASCMSLRGDITLDRDARASGQIMLELSKQAAGLMGITSANALKAQIGTSSYGNVKTSETDDAYRSTISLNHQALSDSTGLYAVADQSAKQVRFSMQFGDTATTSSEDASMLAGMSLGTIDLTVHFPGPISFLEGPGMTKVDSHTARISTALTSDVMAAAGSANGTWTVTSGIDPPKPVAQRLLLPVLLGVVLPLAALGVVLLWRRSRHHPPTSTPAPIDPAEPFTKVG